MKTEQTNENFVLVPPNFKKKKKNRLKYKLKLYYYPFYFGS